MDAVVVVVAIQNHIRKIEKTISKFLESNYCLEESQNDSCEGIELLISRTITVNRDSFDILKSSHGLTLLEAFIILFYEATPGQDFNFFQRQYTNTYIYMLNIAELLIRGKISLCYLEKKSVLDWFNTSCYLKIKDESPCNNHLDGFFDILKTCVSSYKFQEAKVYDCMRYAKRQFLFQDKRKFSGFIDALDGLIGKGIFNKNIDNGIFNWIGMGSYYYKISDSGRVLQIQLRDEIRNSLLESHQINEFNRILLGLLIIGGDIHDFLVSDNKYLRGVLSKEEMIQNKTRLKTFLESNGKFL